MLKNSLRASKSSADYIATNLSDASVEDLGRDVYENLNSIQTALEAVRENQVNIPEKAFYEGLRDVDPPFDADADGLPAEGWKTKPNKTTQGKVLWMSERMVSASGTTKTPWSEPIVITGEVGEKGESGQDGSHGKPGQDGLNGLTSEFRFIASTKAPVLQSKTAIEPVTTDGEPFLKRIPAVEHPNKNFVWVTTAVFVTDGGIVGSWTDPVKYSTPDTTKAVAAYAVSKDKVYPTFNQEALGLPGDDWTYNQPNVPDGFYLWRTERLEWTSGEKQTNWTTPFRMNDVESIKVETRFIASTVKPTIADNNVFEVQTTTGQEFTITLPPVSHPNNSYIWATTGQYDRFKKMTVPWSNPVKYATPDSTQSVKAYAVGRKESYPSFNAQAEDLPGNAWRKEYPTELPKGEYIWVTERLEWTDGTRQTNWTTPYRETAVDSLSVEVRYIASTEAPVITPTVRIPKGWTKSLPNVEHPNKSFVWMITATIDTVNDELVGQWTEPSKYSTPDSTVAGRAYALSSFDAYPSFTPTADGLPGPAWKKEMPRQDSTQAIWMTERLEWTNGTKQTNWATPIRLTGKDGQKGQDGLGHDGAAGAGQYTIVNDSAAITFPVNATDLFRAHTGRNPVKGDGLTFVNAAKTKVQSRQWNGTAWVAFDKVLDGSWLVRGSVNTDSLAANIITSEKLRVNLEITAPTIKGGVVEAVSFRGVNFLGTGTIQGGKLVGTNISNGNNFNVDADGNMTAKNANITGKVTATSGSFTGTVNATNGTFTGTVTGSTISGGQMNIRDKFIVDTEGNLTAKSASITGSVVATSLEAQAVKSINLTSSGTITGGTVRGTQLDNGNGTFRVLSDGTLTATKANITGHITASSLTLAGTIPASIDNSKVTVGSIGAETPSGAQSKADAAKNAAIADAATKAAQAQSNAQKWTEDRIYPNQTKLQITGNYSRGKTGWAIDSEGNAEFNNAVVRGHMYAASLTFTGAIPPSIDNTVAQKNAATDATNKANQAKKDAAADATTKANAAQKAASDLANAAQATANSAQSAANAAQGTANTANGTANAANTLSKALDAKMYPDQSKAQIKGNYAPGSRGWMVDSNGNAEFNNATFRGTVYATNGSFNGTIAAQSGYLNNVTINSSCTIKGTLSASQIVGDIIDVLPKHVNTVVHDIPDTSRREVVSIRITNTQPYTRQLYVNQLSIAVSAPPASGSYDAIMYWSSDWNSGENRLLTFSSVVTGRGQSKQYRGKITIPANSSGTVRFYVRPLNRYSGKNCQIKVEGGYTDFMLLKQSSSLA